METIFEENDNYVLLPKTYIERIVGSNFINSLHWEIFRDNFKIRFSMEPNETIESHYKWSVWEFDDIISRG
jgi:hypothetical protein